MFDHRMPPTHYCSSSSWKSVGSTSTLNVPLQWASREPYKPSLASQFKTTQKQSGILLKSYWWIRLSYIRPTVFQPPMLLLHKIPSQSVLHCLLLMEVLLQLRLSTTNTPISKQSCKWRYVTITMSRRVLVRKVCKLHIMLLMPKAWPWVMKLDFGGGIWIYFWVPLTAYTIFQRRNRTLFRCVFRSHNCIWSALVQNFR